MVCMRLPLKRFCNPDQIKLIRESEGIFLSSISIRSYAEKQSLSSFSGTSIRRQTLMVINTVSFASYTGNGRENWMSRFARSIVLEKSFLWTMLVRQIRLPIGEKEKQPRLKILSLFLGQATTVMQRPH